MSWISLLPVTQTAIWSGHLVSWLCCQPTGFLFPRSLTVTSPLRETNNAMSMSVFIHEHISGTTRPIFAKFFCTCYRWPSLATPLAALRYVMYTSGFMNDVISACTEPYGRMSIILQRVTSLCRYAQENAAAALYMYWSVIASCPR